MKLRIACVSLLGGLLFSTTAYARPVKAASAPPIEIRVVVVTAFEIGADTGDKAGELQAWASDIPVTLPFAAGSRPQRYDPQRKLLVRSTGVGTNRAAVSTAGKTAAESMESETTGLSGLQSALDAAHVLGNRVANETSGHWAQYRNTVPGRGRAADGLAPVNGRQNPK